MTGFSAIILEKNREKTDKTAVIDQNGCRKTDWTEFRRVIFTIASYAYAEKLSGIIPICMDRSMEAVASVLGLNLAGVGIAPLSITTPAERCHNISEQTQNAIWGIDAYNKAMEYKFNAESFFTPEMFENGSLQSTDTAVWGGQKNENAYVVFTSGSTGNPKGVLLSNRAISSGLKRCAGADFFDFKPDARVLQTCSFSFSGCVVDMFSPLYGGCELHILPEVMRGDISAITEYINTYRITDIVFPPQLYRVFDGAESLRCVISGGDKIINLGPKLNARYIGAYGLSETAAIIYSYEYKEPMDTTPIGKVGEDIVPYILDENGNFCDEGELCLSGAVSHGYLNMPEKTRNTFTSNPFSDEPGYEILLHTGDMVKRLENGEIIYVNRRDNMIKINGQRVEPGEIEHAISEFKGIILAVVKAFTDEEGRSFLCAYYTSENEIDTDALKLHLESKLNHYMIPSAFIRLDKIPVNNNGKIDRKQLKIPDFAAFRNEYEPPKTELEIALCKSFEAALNLEKVGVRDDFLRLGGDSISALAVVKECSGYNIAVTDILAGKNPKDIAKLVENKGDDIYTGLSVTDKAPLTESQMGVYLECVLKPESKMYNMPLHIVSAKPAGISANEIKNLIDKVIKSHPSLYARIEEEDGQIYMIKTDFPKSGICDICENEVSPEYITGKTNDFVKVFDMKNGPFCRAEVYFSGVNMHLFFDMHHTAADGSSVKILCRQICDALSGMPVESEKIDAFSLYEAETRRKEISYGESAEYYDKLLDGTAIDSKLVPDFKSNRDGIGTSERYCAAFAVQPVIEMLNKTDITESTLFMGAFGYVLAKMTGQRDSVFTVGESGRSNGILNNTVAMMVKTLPVVMHIDEEKTGRQMLSELQKQFFDSMKYDCISFGELNRKYGVSNAVSFVYQSDLLSGYNGSFKADMETIHTGDTFALLNVSVLKQGSRFTLKIEYRKDLYKASTIERFAQLFISAINSLLSENPMKEITLISEKDKSLIESFNNTYLPYDTSKTFVDIFAETVKVHRNKTAVVFRDKKYTYGEVDEISDRIAAYIHSKNIGRNQTVSILIPRCEYMVIASIGVLKAGAIYEPMDASYPAERLTLMHTDADAKLAIIDRDMKNLLPEYKGDVLYTDEIPALPSVSHEEVAQWAPDADDTYILLYTSGTTGKPKGCMICHKNLTAFIAAHTKTLGIDENSKLTLYPSYGFDAHMADLYPAMANGCELYVIPDEMRLDFPALKEYLESNEITHLLMTTQVARQFILEYSEVKHLRVISLGGESLLSFEPKTNYTIFNLYGPSETTVCVTEFIVDKTYDPIPIGHANGNSHLFVVDTYGRLVPIGAPGELVISGPQVAKGYLNRPEVTAKVFVPNTFEENPDDSHLRCYKSGDIVRYMEDGNIEFIGRRDSQVKIRGFRIELSEVELVIRSYPGIKDAAVIAVDYKGEKCLNAYIVSDETVDIDALCGFIKSQKPAYMVPAGIMQIERIPLNTNQKLDVRKLPPIVKAKNSPSDSKRNLTSLEESLMEILKSIVGEGDFDVQTEFSDAGISSISSIKLASSIFKKFGVHITSNELLDGGNILSVENTIINRLLESIGEEKTEEEPKLLKSYPLTQTQMGIYLESQRVGIDAYNIPMLLKLPQNTDISKLKRAIKSAVANHPSMLSHIHPDINGNVAIYPIPDMNFEIGEIEQSELSPIFTEFEFSQKPLFGFTVIHCKGEKYLFMELHHIIGDGESMSILVEDIDKAYRGIALEPEIFTAFELSAQENEARSGNKLTEAKSAYDSIFRGVSSDYSPCRDNNAPDAYAVLNYSVPGNISEIEAFCKEHKITENILFTAAFALLIAKYTSHEDALFTTIYNGRIDPRTERLVSMLVKTLPIYVQADGKTSVDAFLASVENCLNTVKLNDIFSFADAAREYGVAADVMFIYQGEIMSQAKLDGNILETVPVEFESPKAPLSTEVFKNKNGYSLTIEYNSGHYSKTWTTDFAEAYSVCLESMIKAQTLANVNILSKSSSDKLAAFNNTDIDVEYRPAYKRLTEQAKAHPGRTAIVASPESEEKFKDAKGNRIYEKLTFSQLDNMTNHLANQLIEIGIKPDTPIGVMTGRSKEIYIGEFGILKAGCPFIFLSPAYPTERISYICKEAAIGAIVTTHSVYDAHSEMFGVLGIEILFADDISSDVRAECPEIERQPDSLAYMIYTSGSTGQPKGVTVTQKCLNNLTDNNEKNLQLKYLLSDVMCAVTAFTFDASIMDGYVSLSNGITVCIASEEDIHNPAEFCRLCADNGVKSYVCTPSFASSLTDYTGYEKLAKQLYAICCGGEVFPPALFSKLKSLNPGINLINGYGPSEATVSCTAKLLTSSENIDIGSPINNCKIYIMDKSNHILPMGALGELAVAGMGVGKGYLNRPDLTEKSFFVLNGLPAYKTGDLALITNNGSIEFHGRIDNQVKVRGLRVELGEIESAINSCNGVKNSIVVVKSNKGTQYLAAYYTSYEHTDSEIIKSEISKTLPQYMVPGVFVELDEMPMTANGKIDKKALPQTEFETAKREYIAPSGKTEEALCHAFEAALGLEKVGVTEDFFELGGTSLTATKIAMFAAANNIPIVYKDIFTNPTVKQLALIAGTDTYAGTKSDANADDYTCANEILAKNVWNIGDTVERRPLGDILLTGTTGFLGMHILKQLIENEKGNIYCLLRKGSFASVEHEINTFFYYYFEQPLYELAGDRIHCLDGDLTDRDFILSLKNIKFDTVINCAACVKHFANGDILEKVNVGGVKNLIDLCFETNSRLIQVSTVSVAGEGIGDTPGRSYKLKENALYCHQILENKYISSKFDAEKLVLEAISKGLDGKIMRASNLMPRYSDGEFQINYLTNGFMRQLRGYYALGCIPYSALSTEIEFSPIDDTAGAILVLSHTDSRFTVFHPYNVHKVYMSDVIKAMNEAGLKVERVSEQEFASKMKAAMEDTSLSEEVGGLIAYLNRDSGENRYMIGCDNAFTANVLNYIGFDWSITEKNYLVNSFRKLNGWGFFSF